MDTAPILLLERPELLLLLPLSALAAQGLLVAGLLVGTPGGRLDRRACLAGLFLLFALFALSNALELLGFYKLVLWPAALIHALTFLIGPLFHAFVRLTLAPDPVRFEAGHIIHLLPFLIAAVVLGLAFAGHAPRGLSLDGLLRLKWVAYHLLIALYFGLALRAVRLHVSSLRAFFSTIEDAVFRRLRLMMLLLLVPSVSLLVEFIALAALRLDLGVIGWLNALIFQIGWLYLITVVVLRERRFFEPDEPEAEAMRARARYARSALEVADVTRIGTKLERAMCDLKLYRHPTLTLRDLSDQTRVSENNLSEVLNRHLGQSFFDFVNAWRVEEAKRRLVEEPERPIVEIAFEVGFNARSTFNAAFKKATGSTPSVFRRLGPSHPAAAVHAAATLSNASAVTAAIATK